MPNVRKIAVAWLRKEDWPRWQAIDAELPGYDRWLAKINWAITDAEKKGIIIAEKITIDPDAFSEWCKANGKPIDTETRAEYAAQLMRKRAGAH